MEKKKILLAGLICALAVVLLIAALAGRGQAERSPAGSHGTVPATQTQAQPLPTLPELTTVPETTEPIGTRPTEPEETEPVPTEPLYTAPAETDPPIYETVQFPVELEGGMLTVHSIFQFSGMNPDADNLFGENIAGIQLTNTSDEHMTVAEVTAVLADGTTLTFRAEDVPPGMTVMAFCLEHETLTDPDSCEEVFGYAEFTDSDPLLTELVQVSVSGAEITVTNLSGGDLTNLKVTCHGLLDDSCFGGITYHYVIPSLGSGESATIYAVDCILGMAQVVRLELG